MLLDSPKTTRFTEKWRLEDEQGSSGFEYYYDLELTFEYNNRYKTVKLVKCEIIDAIDIFGHVAMNPNDKKHVECWYVEVYQHTLHGQNDLSKFLG